MSGERIAILIKTFNRPHRLIPTVESIKKFCDLPYRLYIGDDGDIAPAVRTLYDSLESEGHVVALYPERMRVTSARNDLVRRLADEDFVLRLDDDFNFCHETSLRKMVAVLKARPEIGAIAGLERQVGEGKNLKSGQLSSKQGQMLRSGRTLYKMSIPAEMWLYRKAGDVRYSAAGFTRNFLLIRREVFNTVSWNESIVIEGEHTAFMLDLQNAGWELAFTPDSIHEHNESPVATDTGYARVRRTETGRESKEGVFRSLYGIDNFLGISVDDVIKIEKMKRFRKGLLRFLLPR